VVPPDFVAVPIAQHGDLLADNGCLRSDSRATSRPRSPRRASSRRRAFSIGTWVGLLPGRCRYANKN